MLRGEERTAGTGRAQRCRKTQALLAPLALGPLLNGGTSLLCGRYDRVRSGLGAPPRPRCSVSRAWFCRRMAAGAVAEGHRNSQLPLQMVGGSCQQHPGAALGAERWWWEWREGGFRASQGREQPGVGGY